MEECSIFFAVDRQICPLIRKFGRDVFPYVDSKAGHVSGVHGTLAENIRMGKGLFSLGVVQHVLLNAEVVDGDPKMQRRSHADGRHIARPMTAGLHVVKRGEIGGLLHRRKTAAVHHAHAQVINQLLADQLLRIPQGVKDLTRLPVESWCADG